MKTKNFFERYKIFIICTRLARARERERVRAMARVRERVRARWLGRACRNGFENGCEPWCVHGNVFGNEGERWRGCGIGHAGACVVAFPLVPLLRPSNARNENGNECACALRHLRNHILEGLCRRAQFRQLFLRNRSRQMLFDAVYPHHTHNAQRNVA